MNTLIDKILDDIHNIGRTDSTLKVDDWSVLKKGVKSELLKAIMESLPEKRKMTGSLGWKGIEMGITAIETQYEAGYNNALSDVKAKLRELFGE